MQIVHRAYRVYVQKALYPVRFEASVQPQFIWKETSRQSSVTFCKWREWRQTVNYELWHEDYVLCFLCYWHKMVSWDVSLFTIVANLVAKHCWTENPASHSANQHGNSNFRGFYVHIVWMPPLWMWPWKHSWGHSAPRFKPTNQGWRFDLETGGYIRYIHLAWSLGVGLNSRQYTMTIQYFLFVKISLQLTVEMLSPLSAWPGLCSIPSLTDACMDNHYVAHCHLLPYLSSFGLVHGIHFLTITLMCSMR